MARKLRLIDADGREVGIVRQIVAPGSTLSEGTATLGGGVGEQTVRLLGPFHIAHDTTGIAVSGDDEDLLTFPGHELVAIDEGTLVVSVWAVITEAWSNAPSINIGTSEGAAGAGGFWLTPSTASTTDPGTKHQPLLSGSVSGPGPGLYTDDDGLYAVVVYTEEDGPPAAGEADIYALVAEPAT